MTEYPWQTIIGQPPSKANSYKIAYVAGHAKLVKQDAVTLYENTFYLQVGTYKKMKIQGFFELYVRCYFTSKANDLDNALKVILDCLQRAEVIKNDNNCTRIVADKFIDKVNPRIEFKIVEV